MDVKKFLDLISVQRHDFLNHLQVISGLLQLNKQAQAIKYILETGQDISSLSKILHLKIPEAAAAFLMGHNLAASYQIQVSYDVQADLIGCKIPGEKLEQVLEKVLLNIVNYLSGRENINRNLVIKIKAAGGGYECIISFNVSLSFECFINEEFFGWANEELLPYGCRLESHIVEQNCNIKLFLAAG